ncbi:3'-5' exoribonuclease 1 [Chytridiales sp. JEL 0842]|nr:3'-5' exoribonuclease 1 [Chytridiales sp. JEL 0842]
MDSVQGKEGLMRVDELRKALEEEGFSSKGNAKKLKKRLRNVMKAAKEAEVRADSEALAAQLEQEAKNARDPSWQPYDYYCVFDVEATCEENNRTFQHEIIEFPVVLIDGRTQQVIDEFRRFVRPTRNPILSDFCMGLTGIQQQDVDDADTFPKVIEEFEDWLGQYCEFPFENMMWITDGPWDIRNFVTNQLRLINMKTPPYFKLSRYVDLRAFFKKAYPKGGKPNLVKMLQFFNMEFEGREHSGIDDTRNIARIVLAIMKDGHTFENQ